MSRLLRLPIWVPKVATGLVSIITARTREYDDRLRLDVLLIADCKYETLPHEWGVVCETPKLLRHELGERFVCMHV